MILGISRLTAAPVSFSHDLAPILADKCLTCHQEKKAKGKYRLDSFEALLKPGDSKDPPLTAGKPEASSLYTRLVTTEEDDRMPQKDDALPAAQIALFKQWIEQGAKFDGADAKLPLRELLTKKEVPKAPEKYPLALPVISLAFSTDGKSIFTSGYREVLEWSTEDGKLLRRVGGTPERILSLSAQPGGKLLALAGGTPGRSGETLIVDLEKGAVAKRLPGSKDTVLCVAFSPDGSLLASGGTDNTVHLFRTSDWKQLWKAEAHADWIMALTFSADGKDLASVSRDRSARVYDAQSGEIQFTYADHQSAVRSVVFDSEAQTVLSGSTDGELRRWLWHEDEPESKDKKDDKAKDTAKKDETKDKKEVAAAKPEVKPTKDDTKKEDPKTKPDAAVAKAEDKAKKDAAVKKTPKVVLLKGRRSEVASLAVLDDRLFAGNADGHVSVYRLSTYGSPNDFYDLGSHLNVLAASADGSCLAIGGQNGEVRILSTADAKVLLKFVASPGR